MTARTVVLCADDFGMTPGVSRAILALARAGRLSATSAMTTLPFLARFAPALGESGIAVGLHLNLTAGPPLGPMPRLAPGGALPPLGRLMRAALAGRLPEAEAADEIARQLAAFEAAFGRPPDFVDGHQHVHVLPGVRSALLAALARLGATPRPSDRDAGVGVPPSACGGEGLGVGGASAWHFGVVGHAGAAFHPAMPPAAPPTLRPFPPQVGGGRPAPASRPTGNGSGVWLRDPSERVLALLRRPAAAKALVATGLARGLAGDATRAGLAVNRGFSGFSDFSGGAAAVAETFSRSLADLGPAPLVMCHPGEANDPDLAGLDPVVATRPLEAAYLASDAFGRMLEERDLVLAPRPSRV